MRKMLVVGLIVGLVIALFSLMIKGDTFLPFINTEIEQIDPIGFSITLGSKQGMKGGICDTISYAGYEKTGQGWPFIVYTSKTDDFGCVYPDSKKEFFPVSFLSNVVLFSLPVIMINMLFAKNRRE